MHKEEHRNKEEIYMDDIKPHIDAIFNICLDNNIDMVAELFVPTDAKPSLCASTAVIENIKQIPDHMRELAYHQQIQHTFKQHENE